MISELRYQVGESWKGEYNAATEYGNAAVVQDTAGLSVYRSLKPGNVGHPLNDEEWWFCIIDMSSIKALADSLQTLDGEISVHEAERVAAEAERVAAEASRVAAELARVAAEQQRASAESGRQEAEQTRVNQENARVAAEVARVAAEQARVAAEQARVLAENARVEAETQRQLNEENRVAAEAERIEQAAEDHTQAVSDHTQAAADHEAMAELVERADADHTAIESALETASADHMQAVSDHQQAASDHTTAESDHSTAASDHTQAVADHTASEAATSAALAAAQAAQEALANIEAALAQKANIDGYYSTLTAGAAENLVGDTEEESTFTTQMTGGEVEFGSGAGPLTKVQGNGLAWNQLGEAENSKTTNGITFTKLGACSVSMSGTATERGSFRLQKLTYYNTGHKYLIFIKSTLNTNYYRVVSVSSGIFKNVIKTSSIVSPTSNGNDILGLQIFVGAVCDNDKFEYSIIDLSLIFGLGTEPTTVADAEARLAALTPQKPYYQPNAGELFGTKELHLVSYGQNLLNPVNGLARLAPYSYESVVNKYGIAAKAGVTLGTITFTPDATGVAETITPDSNGQFVISGAGTLSLTVSAGRLSDVYVWAVYDGAKDGIENFVPFAQDALEIKASEIYGKLNGEGEYVQVFADGVMRGAGNAHDVIDLQSMTADVNVGRKIFTNNDDWQYGPYDNTLRYTFAPSVGSIRQTRNYILSLPKYNKTIVYYTIAPDMTCGFNADTYRQFAIKDTNYSSAEGFAESMNGVELWYELADANKKHYTDLKLSSDGGETFRDLPTSIMVDNWGVWEQKPSEGLTPVTGHDFEGIAATISTILPMDAVEILKSVQDNGIMTSDQHDQLSIILTALKTAGVISDFTLDDTPTQGTKTFAISIPSVQAEQQNE